MFKVVAIYFTLFSLTLSAGGVDIDVNTEEETVIEEMVEESRLEDNRYYSLAHIVKNWPKAQHKTNEIVHPLLKLLHDEAYAQNLSHEEICTMLEKLIEKIDDEASWKDYGKKLLEVTGYTAAISAGVVFTFLVCSFCFDPSVFRRLRGAYIEKLIDGRQNMELKDQEGLD